MADTPLTQHEFDTWRDEDKQFKLEMRQYVAAQVSLNLATERRMTALENKQDGDDRRVERRVTIISSIVSAVIGALGGFFGGKIG